VEQGAVFGQLRLTPAIRGEPSILYLADIGTIFEGPKKLQRSRTATQSGNFNSRSIAWKRGSLRSGSRNGFVFIYSK